MADLDLEAIRKRAEAATPGPWAIDPGSNGQDLLAYTANEGKAWTVRAYIAGICWKENWQANMHFIAASRTDVPALCDEVERLRADLASAREALWKLAQRPEGTLR